MESRKLSPADIAIVVAVGIFAALFAIEKVYNYDIWWHLRSGQWTLENLQIPRTDPLSFATAGEKWINSSWLAGVLFYLLYLAGGIDLLILLKAALVGLAFAGACWYLIRQGVNPFLAALLLGYAVVVARFRFLLRPAVVMFPAIVLAYWLLTEAATGKRRAAFLLVPFTVLWTNLNASAYIVPVFASFLLIEAFGCRYLPVLRRQEVRPDVRFTALLLFLLSAAILVTPYGFEPVRLFVSRGIVDDLFTNRLVIEEHLPLKWGSRPLYWWLLIATGASFLGNIRKFRLFNLLVYLGTGFLALSSVRYIGIAALLQAMILGLNLSAVLPSINLPRGMSRIVAPLCCIALVVAGWAAFNATFTPRKVYKWGLGVNESRYPVKAVEYLQRSGYSGHLYNSYETGGYLVWKLPEARTLVDGRLLEAHVVLESQLEKMTLPQFGEFLERHDVTGALLMKTDMETLNRFEILPTFVLRYFDEKYLVYLHRDVQVRSVTELSPEFRYVQPQSYDFSYLAPYAKNHLADAVEDELRRAVALSPRNFSARFQLGYFLQLRDRPEAIDAYLAAARLNPALGFSHYNIGLRAGQFAVRHKEWDKAIEILTIAAEHGEESSRHLFLLGTAHYQKRDFAEAEKAFRKVLAMEPGQVATIQNLSFLLMDLGRHVEAESLIKKGLELAPDSESLMYGYATVLQKQNREEAEHAWREFVRKFPESRWRPNAMQHLEKP